MQFFRSLASAVLAVALLGVGSSLVAFAAPVDELSWLTAGPATEMQACVQKASAFEPVIFIETSEVDACEPRLLAETGLCLEPLEPLSPALGMGAVVTPAAGGCLSPRSPPE